MFASVNWKPIAMKHGYQGDVPHVFFIIFRKLMPLIWYVKIQHKLEILC